MTFTPVDKLPDRIPHNSHKKNAEHLKEFLKMNVKYARMDYSALEYTNLHSARAAIAVVAKYNGLPVKPTIINNEIYLINLELEEETK